MSLLWHVQAEEAVQLRGMGRSCFLGTLRVERSVESCRRAPFKIGTEASEPSGCLLALLSPSLVFPKASQSELDCSGVVAGVLFREGGGNLYTASFCFLCIGECELLDLGH